MSIKDEIDRTKSQIQNHREAILALEKHGHDLGMKILGVEVGDRIIVTDHGKEFEASVIGCEYWSWSPQPKALKVKKDGTVGSASAGYIRQWRKK